MIRLWGSSLAHAVPTWLYGGTWVEEDEHTQAGLWPLKAMCLWQVAKCVAIGRGRTQTFVLPGYWGPHWLLAPRTLLA